MATICNSIETKGSYQGQACSVFAGFQGTKCFHHCKKNLSEPGDVCPICHEGNQDFQIACCKQWFHADCLIKTQVQNKRCPMCRQSMSINRDLNQYIHHNFKVQTHRLALKPISIDNLVKHTINKEIEKVNKEFDKKAQNAKESYERELARFEKEKACQLRYLENEATQKKIATDFDETKQNMEQIIAIAKFTNPDIGLVKAALKLLERTKETRVIKFPNMITIEEVDDEIYTEDDEIYTDDDESYTDEVREIEDSFDHEAEEALRNPGDLNLGPVAVAENRPRLPIISPTFNYYDADGSIAQRPIHH
jgi:hypothetical protein